MKINAEIKVGINSGAASIIYAIGFFGICWTSKCVPAVATNLIGVLGAWTLGFGGYLVKRGHDNSINVKTLEAEKLKVPGLVG